MPFDRLEQGLGYYAFDWKLSKIAQIDRESLAFIYTHRRAFSFVVALNFAMSIHLSLARHANDDIEPLARCESRLLQFPTPVRNIKTRREPVLAKLSATHGNGRSKDLALYSIDQDVTITTTHDRSPSCMHRTTGFVVEGPTMVQRQSTIIFVMHCPTFSDASDPFAFCAFPQLPHLVKHHLINRLLNFASYVTHRMIDIQTIESGRCVYETPTAVTLCVGYH